MLRSVSLPILLYLIGLLGGVFPLLFNKDGTSLIIIGFGAATLLIHNKIKEGNMDISEGPGAIKTLTVVASLIGICIMGYNAYKFNTNFNRVLSAGFIILQIWEVFLVFATINQKLKK